VRTNKRERRVRAPRQRGVHTPHNRCVKGDKKRIPYTPPLSHVLLWVVFPLFWVEAVVVAVGFLFLLLCVFTPSCLHLLQLHWLPYLPQALQNLLAIASRCPGLCHPIVARSWVFFQAPPHCLPHS
jgi:hypothetical protein